MHFQCLELEPGRYFNHQAIHMVRWNKNRCFFFVSVVWEWKTVHWGPSMAPSIRRHFRAITNYGGNNLFVEDEGRCYNTAISRRPSFYVIFTHFSKWRPFWHFRSVDSTAAVVNSMWAMPKVSVGFLFETKFNWWEQLEVGRTDADRRETVTFNQMLR